MIIAFLGADVKLKFSNSRDGPAANSSRTLEVDVRILIVPDRYDFKYRFIEQFATHQAFPRGEGGPPERSEDTAGRMRDGVQFDAE